MRNTLKIVRFVLVLALIFLFSLVVFSGVIYVISFNSTTINSNQSTNFRKIKTYRKTEVDQKSGKITQDLLTSYDGIEEEVFSYWSENGKYVLISNLGKPEYCCKITCTCYNGEDGNERRMTRHSFVVWTTVVFVAIIAMQLIGAYRRSRLDEKEICEKQMEENCDPENVEGETEDCKICDLKIVSSEVDSTIEKSNKDEMKDLSCTIKVKCEMPLFYETQIEEKTPKQMEKFCRKSNWKYDVKLTSSETSNVIRSADDGNFNTFLLEVKLADMARSFENGCRKVGCGNGESKYSCRNDELSLKGKFY